MNRAGNQAPGPLGSFRWVGFLSCRSQYRCLSSDRVKCIGQCSVLDDCRIMAASHGETRPVWLLRISGLLGDYIVGQKLNSSRQELVFSQQRFSVRQIPECPARVESSLFDSSRFFWTKDFCRHSLVHGHPKALRLERSQRGSVNSFLEDLFLGFYQSGILLLPTRNSSVWGTPWISPL